MYRLTPGPSPGQVLTFSHEGALAYPPLDAQAGIEGIFDQSSGSLRPLRFAKGISKDELR